MLARGELQTIGATTLDEYRKYLEKDAALERRFQPIQVAEPSIAHTIEMLKGLRDRYEAHHRVTITDEALVSAATLADRYISDRFLPDKAIDLIDEAGSRLRIRRMTAPADLREYDDKIADVRQRKEVPAAVVIETPPAPAGDGSGSGDDLQSSIDNGIKKIDDTTFEIDKGLVEKVLVNPMAVAKGARIVPAMKNGKPEGFKLYAIRPTSVYSKLGLTHGDTLTSINGFELTSADKALEVYTKLREATSLELEVTRRGKPVTLKYTIR
jgi:ATP-dependent Clp protease ATP-binding subunit ClpA